MGSGDSKSSSVTIRCKGGEAIGITVAAAQRFSAAEALGAPAVAHLAIIVEELVTNLVEHGGAGDRVEIELTLVREGSAVLIGLGDDGPAFDPRGVAPQDAIPERGGGTGLDLVRAWAEIVDYRWDRGWNRLDVRMPLDGR